MYVISEAAREQWREISDALAAAFHDDPVFSWLLPNDATRLTALRRYFGIETRRIVLKHRRTTITTHGEAVNGVALVLPPGQWRSPIAVQGAYGPVYTGIFGRRLPRALGVLTKMERLHPREPHVYLPYIGVIPAAQGQGLGTALLEPILERCDRERMPAYLEASNPSSARLYERLGFVTAEEIRPFGSPPIALMSRRPGISDA